jgi:hypothetical protein
MLKFIEDLKIILFSFNSLSRFTADELQTKYNWEDDDHRIYFYNALGQVCFLHGLTLNFIDDEILQNKNRWRENQNYFDLNNPIEFDSIIYNYTFLVRDNFFVDFLILVEHALRIYGEQMTPAIIDSKICTIKDLLVKQLRLNPEYKKLFDVLFKIRNTIHNAGLFSDKKPSVNYKNRTFEFNKKQATPTDLANIEFLFSETLTFMKILFTHVESERINKMEHPYKALFP